MCIPGVNVLIVVVAVGVGCRTAALFIAKKQGHKFAMLVRLVAALNSSVEIGTLHVGCR